MCPERQARSASGASHARPLMATRLVPVSSARTSSTAQRTRCNTITIPADFNNGRRGAHAMSTVTTNDGTEIYYKDWGNGPVVTFSHGWPLNADAWDGQMLFLAQNGYRCVALDRRGHGRSSQASAQHDMDGYADD